ncbi:MAG: DUF547 domain-containing protein [Deltaproteobacteria bacterium]|nr:DUF547 domain-containing protein [Deltaproteobacteria bacterium]
MKCHWYKVYVSFIVCFLIMGLVTTVPAAQGIDHRLYAGLLKKYVKKGVVNYQGFKKEESVLDQYLKVLQEVDSKVLSRSEQFAFYINAYNAWTIKLILSEYPGVKSIKELGSLFKSPWKKEICHIDGGVISLDDIEHGILRPRFKDSRVHFAVNCASKSCPPLRSEPYHGSDLDLQLDEMTRDFINDTDNNHLEDHTLYVSTIFKWFAEDFNEDIIGFFFKYGNGDLKRRLEDGRGKIKVKYLDYDWSLNGK